MELKYIVYITINLCNGKFYIGVHKTNPDVFDGYIGNNIWRLQSATLDLPFHKAVRKYGYLNFKRTTILIFPNTEEGRRQAFDLEATLVNSTLLKSKSCYNVALGGFGGLEEIKKRVYMFDLKGEYLRSFSCTREAAFFIDPENIEVVRAGIKNNCQGTSNSCAGYYWSYFKKFGYTNDTVRKVAQYTISGKFLRYFDSMAEAEATFGISNIYYAITKKKSSGGFLWRYYEGDNSDIPILVTTKTKNKALPIKMYLKSGEFIKDFDCVSDCVKEYPDLLTSQINRVLKGVIKSTKGYSFKYQDEDIVQTSLE